MHKLYWLCEFISIALGFMISLSLEVEAATDYIPEVFIIVDFGVLNIYTLFIRRQDIYDFE